MVAVGILGHGAQGGWTNASIRYVRLSPRFPILAGSQGLIMSDVLASYFGLSLNSKSSIGPLPSGTQPATAWIFRHLPRLSCQNPNLCMQLQPQKPTTRQEESAQENCQPCYHSATSLELHTLKHR